MPNAKFTVTRAAWEHQYERAERAEAALKFKTGLIEDISADCERAEAALADLRARVEALAGEWERDPNLHYFQRYTSDVRRALGGA